MRFDQIRIGHIGLTNGGNEIKVCAIDENDETVMDENGNWYPFAEVDFPRYEY